MRTELALALGQYGFGLTENDLAIRDTGGGIEWVLQISSRRRFGVQYCWANCGLRHDAAMKSANLLWRELDKRVEAAAPEVVVPMISADRWFQGRQYLRAERLQYVREPDEPLSTWYHRAVQDTWERGEATWNLFKTTRDLFDLIDRAEDPFPRWVGTNGVLCAFLYMQLAELEGLGVAPCMPTLERLWTVIVNSSGLHHLKIEDMIEVFERRLR